VKDAVWGMIDLSHREVLVLDSPPIQRLRRVRQLGLGHLVYPTAGYSRFEHSLGALHQADRMIRAVASRTGRRVMAGGEWKWTLEAEVLSALSVTRLAALLHDVGHLPLSHVSERFYEASECPFDDLVRRAADLRDDVREHLGGTRPSLSESLSVATVLTPSFWSFLTEEVQYERREAASAVAAIVGRAPSPRQAFIYQLITNVIDADKLDYMFRDGLFTGVPLAVDLERLLFKLKCLELPFAEMPRELQDVADNEEPGLVLGIDLAGQRLAYDVTVARTMLFERVYLHHKTRAAERVAMARLAELAVSPAALLRYDDRVFLPDETGGVRGSSRFASMLSERDLPLRAYALSYNFLPRTATTESPEPAVTPEAQTGWDRVMRELNRATRRQRLEQKILLIARRIASCVSAETTITDIWVDTRPPRGDVGTWDLWVETPDGERIVARTTDARSAAYAHSPAHTFFIYASGRGAVPEVAFLAAEYVMATRYGLVTGRRGADHAKVSFRAAEAQKRTLEGKVTSFYDHVGRLRPEPRYLRETATGKRLNVLAERFHHYHGQSDVRVDRGRIVDFLRQFPEAESEEMLGVLEAIRYLDRGDLGERLAEFLAEGAEPDEQFVVLTRRPEKSGAHLPYFLADRRETRLNVVPLDTALTNSSPITFFDDCVVSGRQPRTAVQTWLGLDPDLPEERDELADRLGPDEVEALRGRRVRFRFAYGWTGGLSALRELTQENDLGGDVAARITEDRDRPLSAIPTVSPSLTTFLGDVGRDLLRSTKGQENPSKWTDSRCKAFALGYGDCQQLVVLVYNTPTGTVTSLWKSGRFGGAPWLPLFPRRGEAAVTRW
jgi:HD superfamily phosphohydrolase